MRTTRLSMIAVALVLLFWQAAAAENFSFGISTEPSTEPAFIFDLTAAQLLRDMPVFQSICNGESLRLYTTAALPADYQLTAATTDGIPLELIQTGESFQVIGEIPDSCWATLQWTSDGLAFTARYLAQANGHCELWEATADDGSRLITRRNSGTYINRPAMKDITSATLYYRADGQLLSSLLLGDTRDPESLQLTVQYDRYGRPDSITAADLQHTYTYCRPLAAWLDETGAPAEAEQLPAFDIKKHPAPAALPLDIGTIYRSETAAGIDRELLLANAPVLTDCTSDEFRILITADADDAELVVGNTMYFSSSLGSLLHEDGVFTAVTEGVGPNDVLEITLRLGTVTAKYVKSRLISVSDSSTGVSWTEDGFITMSKDALSVRYSPKGRLAEATVESPDGATLTYNVQGRLSGWAMDGYLWILNDGWRTTAVNENGSIIHPSAKAPGSIRLADYPAINIQE